MTRKLKFVSIIIIASTFTGFMLMLFNCSYPHWLFDQIEIEANFYEDGSCSFASHGNVLSDDTYRQELELMSDFCTNCTPDHIDGYFLTCRTDIETRSSYRQPELYIAIIRPKQSAIGLGAYEVDESDDSYDNPGTHAAILAHPEYRIQNIANGPNGAKLVATQGKLQIEKILSHQTEENNKPVVLGALESTGQRRGAGW